MRVIKNFFSQEFAKLKEMNFTDKRQYIWEYYKLHIFFIALMIFIMGSLINTWFINPPKRDYLYISWQAGVIHREPIEGLAGRLSVIVSDPGRYTVTVTDYTLTGEPQMDQAMITRFHALLSVGGVHALIATQHGIYEAAMFGILRPVQEVLDIVGEHDRDIYAKLMLRLLYISFHPEGDEELPVVSGDMAICIAGMPMVEELGIRMDDLYIGLIINSERVDELARALIVMYGGDVEGGIG